jgi:hypothetical protein
MPSRLAIISATSQSAVKCGFLNLAAGTSRLVTS